MPRNMDRSFVYNLQPGQLQGAGQQQQHQQEQEVHQGRYITTQTTTSPSVSHGILQDDRCRYDPCPALSSSSGSVASTQHPWGLGTSSQRYTLSPSFSPQHLSPSGSGEVHPFSFHEANHHRHHHHHCAAYVSPLLATKSDTNPNQVKLEFSPLEQYNGSSSSDWTCDIDLHVPFCFDPDPDHGPGPGPENYYTFSEIPAHTRTITTTTKTTTTSPTLPSPVSPVPTCDQQSPTAIKIEPKREGSRSSPGEAGEDENAESPYSKLIYQALCAADDMKLPLQGIYSWFEQNTAKGKEGSTGWQNSIRHNLSMNAGFVIVREELPNSRKHINLWRLTDEAIKNGIQSTTRYRKQANQGKGPVSEPPAPHRQRSGAKGGKARKITAKLREHASTDELSSRYHSPAVPVAAHRHRPRQRQRQRQQLRRHQQQQEREREQPPSNGLYYQRYVPCLATVVPAFPEPDPASSTESLGLDLSNDEGCTDPICGTPVFSGMGSGLDCLFDIGWYEMDATYHSSNVLPNSLPNGLLHHSGWSTPEISTDIPLGV